MSEATGHNWIQLDGTWLCSWCGCMTGATEALAQCPKFPSPPPTKNPKPDPVADKVVALFDALRAGKKRP